MRRNTAAGGSGSKRKFHENHYTYINRAKAKEEEVVEVISLDEDAPFIKDEVVIIKPKEEIVIEEGDIDFLGEFTIRSQPARRHPPPSAQQEEDCQEVAAFLQQEKDTR
jgi:hypothetical protein